MKNLNSVTTYDTNSPITSSLSEINAIAFIEPAKAGEKATVEVDISGENVSAGALQVKLSSDNANLSVTKGVTIGNNNQKLSPNSTSVMSDTVPNYHKTISMSFTMPKGDINDMELELKMGNYLVEFVDWNDEELGADAVNHSENAEAPADPKRSGYKFSGWNNSFDNVTSDLTVKATYTKVADNNESGNSGSNKDNSNKTQNKTQNKTNDTTEVNPLQAGTQDAMDLDTSLYTILVCIILALATQTSMRRRDSSDN